MGEVIVPLPPGSYSTAKKAGLSFFSASGLNLLGFTIRYKIDTASLYICTVIVLYLA